MQTVERVPVGSDRQARPRVLVVEDDPLFRALLSGWLESGGLQVRAATSVTDAARCLARGPFDLVLLDLNLPDARGLETLDRVASKAPDTPIIVLTGQEDAWLGREALRRGARDFMMKSDADPDVFRRCLWSVLERPAPMRGPGQDQISPSASFVPAASARRSGALGGDKDRNRDSDAGGDADLPELGAAGIQAWADSLRPIRFQVQVLRLELPADTSARLRDAAAALEGCVADLDRRLRDVLDVAALPTGASVLVRRRFDLADTVRRVVAAHEPSAHRNRLALDSLLAPGTQVLGDEARLQNVVAHLVKNAVQNTPGGGRVVVQLDRVAPDEAASDSDAGAGAGGRDGEVAVLRVEDDGVGMDGAEAARALAGEGGRGVGLAYCRAVVAAHGGTLLVHSPGTGLGTSVEVRLATVRSRASSCA